MDASGITASPPRRRSRSVHPTSRKDITISTTLQNPEIETLLEDTEDELEEEHYRNAPRPGLGKRPGGLAVPPFPPAGTQAGYTGLN